MDGVPVRSGGTVEPFESRQEAGRTLAAKLGAYAGREDLAVLALPRGGVPVAFEVAKALEAPLDVLVVRKLGAPGFEELAMGAIASGGIRILNPDVVTGLEVSDARIERVATRELAEVERRERVYRGDREPLNVRGRTVLLVDDGVATGATMRAGVAALRRMEPARIVVAVPTAAQDSLRQIRSEADEVVCLATPEPYVAVGRWYHDFPQVEDDEVRTLMDRAAEALAAGREGRPSRARSKGPPR